MQSYIKLYLDYFNKGEQDIVLCERCGARSNQIHHIYGRGKGKDIITNLMALCVNCHSLAHASKEYVSKKEFQEIHNKYLRRWM
jgi:hypothetical protein